jgi:hypothetical protein
VLEDERLAARVRTTAIVAVLLLCAIAATSAATPDEQLTEAVAWVTRGEVEPYPLLGFGGSATDRRVVGRVYTPLIRLALLVQSAIRAGQDPEAVRREPANQDVLIAWEVDPNFSPLVADDCNGQLILPYMVMGLRPFRARHRLRPFQNVSFEQTSNARLLAPFRSSDVNPVRAVVRIPKSELRPDPLLVWDLSYQCPEGRTITEERFAYISAEDLRRWR